MQQSVREIHDIEALAGFFRADPFLHLYALGDLDDFFRPHARWWGLGAGVHAASRECAAGREDQAQSGAVAQWSVPVGPVGDVPTGVAGGLREVVLLYDPGSLPVVLAFTRDAEGMRELLDGIRDQLPDRFYAHFSPGMEEVFADGYCLESRGRHLRMGLIDESKLNAAPGESAHADAAGLRSPGAIAVSGLSRADLGEVLEFFEASYPGNWFDPRMIDTGRYVGARIDGRLCAVAGVHVYSETYRVAALGNIATLPEHRGKGLAGLVTRALCRALGESVDWIGLNVHADNAAAIACYRRLGFARVADYGEFMVERRG